MSKVFITSDWHLGHKNICNFRTQFPDEVTHCRYILNNYKQAVTKRDKVFFLGDIIFDVNYLHNIKDLPGRKVLILGNHCTEYLSCKELLTVFDEIHSLIKYKGFWLSHAPIHPEELRGAENIHGHTHARKLRDPRYFNACLENTDYKPILFENIKNRQKRLSSYS